MTPADGQVFLRVVDHRDRDVPGLGRSRAHAAFDHTRRERAPRSAARWFGWSESSAHLRILEGPSGPGIERVDVETRRRRPAAKRLQFGRTFEGVADELPIEPGEELEQTRSRGLHSEGRATLETEPSEGDSPTRAPTRQRPPIYVTADGRR
jgi:hypothetical protein